MLGDIPVTDRTYFQKRTTQLDMLKIISVLQFNRDCWEVIPTFPFIRINSIAVKKAMESKRQFMFLTHNFLTQNLHSDDVRSKIFGSMLGPGIDAGISPGSKIIPDGLVNPLAFSFVDFNGSLNLVGRPFLALGTNLIVIENDEVSQYVGVGKLDSTIKEGHALVVSENFSYRPLQDIHDYLAQTYWHSLKTEELTDDDQKELAEAFDVVFECNEEVEEELKLFHKRKKEASPVFNHTPVRTSRYGILNHREDGSPYIEFNGSMLHFEKALEELHFLSGSETFEKKMRSSVYLVASLQATIEGLSLYFWKKAFGEARIDKNDSSTVVLVKAVNKLSTRKGKLIKQSSPEFDLLETIRKFRNHFLHIGVSELEVNPDSGIPVAFEKWVEYQYSKERFNDIKGIFRTIFDSTGVLPFLKLGDAGHFDIKSID